MRRLVRGLLLVVMATGCGPRQVDVRTTADLPPEAALVVENTLSEAVNVYVVVGGSEMFLRQVPPHQSARLPLRGVSSGRRVALRATTRDGARTFTRRDVEADGTIRWVLP